jgi:hypothetical protein
VITATDTHAKIEEMLEGVCSVVSVPRLHNEHQLRLRQSRERLHAESQLRVAVVRGEKLVAEVGSRYQATASEGRRIYMCCKLQ